MYISFYLKKETNPDSHIFSLHRGMWMTVSWKIALLLCRT